MCGLFGYQVPDSNPLSTPEITVMGYILGWSSEQRGKHSCGFAGWQPDNTVLLRKEDDEFTSSGLTKDLDKCRNLIGHTRYATVGAHTAENAHPFHYKHIIGAHNGGIYNHRELEHTYKERKVFNVDSQHLIAQIADMLAYEELRGYGTVTWLDLYDPGVIYICRMKNGEFALEKLADGGVVWASTDDILRKGLQSVNLYSASRKMQLEEGVVYRVHDGEITKTDDTITLGTYESTAKSWADMQADAAEKASRPRRKVYGTVTPITSATGSQEVASPAGASKSDCTPATYHAELEHYSRATAYAAKGLAVPRKPTPPKCVSTTTPLDTLLGELYWFTDDEFEMVQVLTDTLTRRQRRKYQSIAFNVANHARYCVCKGCAKLANLVNDMLSPDDEAELCQ